MKKLPVGIQVYGLRDLLEDTPENFADVMRQVKAMGYDGVELAGLYGLEPEYIRKTLDEIGLVPISAHVPLAPNTDGYETVKKEMTRIGQVMKENGIKLEYHNHDFEFVRLPDGTFGFDDIYKQIPEDILKVEPDLCWIKVAGQSPVEYLKKYGSRCEIVHLKDFIKEGNPRNMYKLIGIETEQEEEDTGIFEFRPVGFGMQIWEPVLDAVIEAGSKWVVVEQDEHYGLTPAEAARRSREYLKILGW